MSTQTNAYHINMAANPKKFVLKNDSDHLIKCARLVAKLKKGARK